ncbi:MAG: SDR family NAD(P)-dependent oxidoreductase [Leptolyngbyaceae cyanobacterium]
MSEQKVVIITGAGSGIGAATAKRFAQDGYHVVLNGRTEEKLQAVADAIASDGTLICPGDVSDAGDVDALIAATIDAFGQINALVNNAGIAVFDEIQGLSVEAWDKVMAIDARGPFLTIRAALPHLIAVQGAVVNVSSVSGIGGDWRGFAYNAAKGALSNMTRAMALDLGAKGVRVNAVAPSLTKTDMASGVMENQSVMENFEQRLPMQRPADPEEIADVIAFLASHDARFVNGVILPVDGGLSASNGQPKLG